MKRSLATATLVASLLGCGIGSSETVEELQPEELADLDQTSTTSSAPETLPPVETTPGSVEPTTTIPIGPTTTVPNEDVTMYFINGSELVPVQVPLPVNVQERQILKTLGGGPPPDEFEAGIRNAVPIDLVRRVRHVGRLITVDFNGEPFRSVDSDDQRLMIAQVVLTLTSLPDIHEVLFTTDGEPLRVYQRDNELTEPGEPVTRGDYEELLGDEALPD